MSNITRYIFIISLFIGFALNGFSQGIPQAGLQAWYPFTTNANDSSGNNNNGTVYGATLTTDRFNKPNHAYGFNGTSAYIDFGNVLNNVFSGSQFTISMWIMPYNYMTNNCFFAKDADDYGCSESEYQITFRIWNNAFNFSYWGSPTGGSARYVTVTSPIPNYNEWYCIEVTYDGSINTNNGLDRVNIYINGNHQTASLNPTPIGPPGTIGIAAAHMAAGNYLTPAGIPCQYSTFFHGKIDDIAVYNRILSSQEIQDFCNNTDTIITENCGDVFVPNAFSPNNDGVNDTLLVRGKCIKTLQFAIYNRWGEKVFETTDQNIGWDGKYKNKLMDTGIFDYFLNVTLTSGDIINKKGNISLFR